jgi:hypothetical protein
MNSTKTDEVPLLAGISISKYAEKLTTIDPFKDKY